MDRGDAGAAVNLLERAEALLPPREMDLAVQLSLTRSLAESGRIDDAISRASRIAGQCSAAGDHVGELRAKLEQIRWQASADPERWVAELDALVEEARPAIEQDGDAAARAARRACGRLCGLHPLPASRRACGVYTRYAARPAGGRPMVRDQHACDGGRVHIPRAYPCQRGTALAGRCEDAKRRPSAPARHDEGGPASRARALRRGTVAAGRRLSPR